MAQLIKIRRINEQEDISDDDIQELGLQPEIADISDVDTQLPAEGDSSADPGNVMVLTVADFLEKCKEIDPLVCMGITSFIENNQDAFGGSDESEDDDTPSGIDGMDDISFSDSIANKDGGQEIDISFPRK